MYASRTGSVSLIGSTVTGCSAGFVRRVELAARVAAPHGRGARDKEGHGRLTALPSQPQGGGVVYAVYQGFASGAVLIIRSTVTGCSAGVRHPAPPSRSLERERGRRVSSSRQGKESLSRLSRLPS